MIVAKRSKAKVLAMVSIAQASESTGVQLSAGLSAQDADRVLTAYDFVVPLYTGKQNRYGQDALFFSEGVASLLAQIRTDAQTRIAALLFLLIALNPKELEGLETRFGQEVVNLVSGVLQLARVSGLPYTYNESLRGKKPGQKTRTPIEVLRKMILAMASDIRVVLVQLALRVMELRYFAELKQFSETVLGFARESLDLYSPLANRLGVWQFKWEMEDLSFRFLEPVTYKRIAKMLEERRVERNSFIDSAIEKITKVLSDAGIKAEVSGRPKHIYSIWNKMRGKSIEFSELYDVRAVRIIVTDIKSCYTVLGLMHHLWTPITKEFDDYISRPKSNGYQSLHTVVVADDGRALEVQIRTEEMHRFAENGVAAHWRYKEGGRSSLSQDYEDRLAWLRKLLSWKTEIADPVVNLEQNREEWLKQIKAASIDDRIYVLTPHARVIEIPIGSTPIDFAYYLHTDVGHRCRGARVDGVMVPLNTPLKNAQTVEIITNKSATGLIGPSRDWLNGGYIASPRTRAKVRAWFNAIDQQTTIASGRFTVEKTLQRLGKTAVNLDDLAQRLGFGNLEDFLLSVGKDEYSVRQIELVFQSDLSSKPTDEFDATSILSKSSNSSVEKGSKSGVLVVGTDGLMTQLARCCKPAPPDEIIGFVTRGKGVSIHRCSCKNFTQMRFRAPERVIQTAWGQTPSSTVYPVDLFILANDRQGLLRDISDVLSKEKINVIGVQTQSQKGQARMLFTTEILSTSQLNKALVMIRDVLGVQFAKRQ